MLIIFTPTAAPNSFSVSVGRKGKCSVNVDGRGMWLANCERKGAFAALQASTSELLEKKIAAFFR
jgi:hypothetical protein